MKRKIIPYNPKLKQLAKGLRGNMTLGEVLLWQQLKGMNIMGYDFDRQRPIDKYIVDFYCKEAKLAIEVDGSSHYSQLARMKDEHRQRQLESLGVRFLRFDDSDVRNDVGGVVRIIKKWLEENKPNRGIK